MPTYEYVCEKCGRNFDYFQSMNDPRLTECVLDGCDGKVRRKIGTGAGIIFKGSGFYQTDYRSESYKSGEKKAGEAAKKSESSGDGKGAKDAKAGGSSGGSGSGGASSSSKNPGKSGSGKTE